MAVGRPGRLSYRSSHLEVCCLDTVDLSEWTGKVRLGLIFDHMGVALAGTV